MKPTRRRGAVTAAAITLAAGLLAACGGSSGADTPEVASLDEETATTTDTSNGGGSGSGDESTADPEQALLDYAECMREHGIDMPDPQISEEGGGVLIQQEDSGIDPNSEEFQEAEKACEHFLEDARGDIEVDPEQQAEMQDQLLEFAQCMRDHGIDMPDPVFGEDGRVEIQARAGEGNPRDDEDFQTAQEECNEEVGMEPGPAPSSGPEDEDE
jgi:hypothetical protein